MNLVKRGTGTSFVKSVNPELMDFLMDDTNIIVSTKEKRSIYGEYLSDKKMRDMILAQHNMTIL